MCGSGSVEEGRWKRFASLLQNALRRLFRARAIRSWEKYRSPCHLGLSFVTEAWSQNGEGEHGQWLDKGLLLPAAQVYHGGTPCPAAQLGWARILAAVHGISIDIGTKRETKAEETKDASAPLLYFTTNVESYSTSLLRRTLAKTAKDGETMIEDASGEDEDDSDETYLSVHRSK